SAYAKHWGARIVFLVVLPVSVYIAIFAIHFKVLYRDGHGGAQMSSLFQAQLEGNNFYNSPLYSAYGSIVTIKTNGHGCGLLHSHIQTYPSGSEEQQVTCYPHRDANNYWLLANVVPEEEDPDTITLLGDGALVRLFHLPTRTTLHAHDFRAPVSTSTDEVSCHNSTLGDLSDVWKVEIVKDVVGDDTGLVRSMTTLFRLRNVARDCLLRFSGAYLPEWGFKQGEVVCDAAADPLERNSLWNVEQHHNERLPPGNPELYRPRGSVWRDLAELNVAMWATNSQLTGEPGAATQPDQAVSRPHQWPLGLIGVRLTGWPKDDGNDDGMAFVRFFLAGNPVVWIGSAAGVAVVAAAAVAAAVAPRWARARLADAASDDSADARADLIFTGKVGLAGWLLHYVPFWFLKRIL
ncbi:Protein O-mannosyltransferase 2, partial [Cladochytrium tenue]